VHVVREDPFNRSVLYSGPTWRVTFRADRGAAWQKFMTGLPVVPVHDLKVHPREHELIAATHGRGIWIVDVAALEQLADSVLAASAYLFEPKTAYEYGEAVRANTSGGHKQFVSPSPQYGAEIVYRLTGGDRRTQTKVVIPGRARRHGAAPSTARAGRDCTARPGDSRVARPPPQPLSPSQAPGLDADRASHPSGV